MFLIVAVAGLTITPTPHDLIRAETLLGQPVGTYAEQPTEWNRTRLALLAVMRRDGAVDPGGEHAWFCGCRWDEELDHAREVMASVRGCPESWEGDWLPDPNLCRRIGQLNHEHAARLMELLRWETDRAGILEAAACESEVLAGVWWELARAGEPGGWQRPRRVRLADARLVLGPGWDAREWPESAVWWSLRPR